MFAAGEGNTQAAELLLEFGADLKARSKAGYTPLLFAVRNNHLDTVKFLLSKGADPNDKIGDNTPALSMSVLNADFDVASVLLDAGANPNVADQRGESPAQSRSCCVVSHVDLLHAAGFVRYSFSR